MKIVYICVISGFRCSPWKLRSADS